MIKSVLSICCVCFTLVLSAQLAPAIDLFDPVGDILYNIALDVDGDGDLEVVCATSLRLFWLELEEDGYFSRHHLITGEALGYRSLVAADMNEDGDDDIVYASNDGGLGVYFNLGGGSFGPATEIFNPGVIIDCYVADFNGDNHLDIVTGRSTGVHWVAGNGNGTFASAQLLSDEHATTTSVHAEDLDGDGDQDVLVAAGASDRLSWHENLGNGTFADYRVLNDTHDNPTEVTTADLDGDLLPDIVCANRSEDEDTGAGLVWYRNLGNGEFELVDTLLARGWHEYAHLADMDADGDMDIVSCHGLDEMDWLANDGNGNFGPPQELQDLAYNLRFVETPDLNQDGFPDILYGINNASPEKETVLWRASTAAGEWALPALVTIGADDLSKPALGDVDQDGLLDIIVGSEGAEALVWFRNEGFEFSPARLIARQNAYDPTSVEVIDFNNDGWPDILAPSIDPSAVGGAFFNIYINNGDETFTATPPFNSGYNPQRDLQMVDMDSDGDLDMLWASPGLNSNPTGGLGWVRNDGDSWSESIQLLSAQVKLFDVLAADFDEDGQMELVVCRNTVPPLVRMEHTGNGNFSAPEEIPSNFVTGMYAQAADINGDGLPDLLASEENISGPHELAWWPSLGDGQLGSQQTIYAGDIPLEKFVFIDFDLDGRKDIVASTYLGGEPMRWLQQLPDGSFTAPMIMENSPTRVRNFRIEDLNHDGDWDIIGSTMASSSAEVDRLFVAYNLANDANISGVVFYDEDADGEQASQELGVGRTPISVTPDALAIFTDENGRFTIYGAAGTYTLQPELDDCFTLSSTPTAYEVTFDGITNIDSLRFGVAPNTATPEAGITLASAPTRCGFTVPFWLNYRNDGCWTFDGQAYLVQSELATFVSATPEPSNIVGDTLFWDFSTLSPGASRSVELMMTIAGVEFIGSTLVMPSGVIPFNENGEALAAETFDFFSLINCAYDPNDKQVYPNRAEQAPFTENYTLFDETLLYTLRFQNTGTDTAFNIVLRDQLSEDLDWSTFRPGSSSHPYEATLAEDGLLSFHFRDILLVDSITNEPLSHGFVQFEIQAKADLAEETIIENTAGIYFDFNPPIVTNTVNSILVETLPDFSPAAAYTYSTIALEAIFMDASTNDPISWRWDFGDGTTSTLQNPSHIYAEDGTYTVCLTAENDWGSTQYCEMLTVSLTSTTGVGAVTDIQLHPNPAHNSVWINSKTASLPQQLTLYSAAGQPLRIITLNENRMRWELDGLSAGSYWLRTENGAVLPLVVVK